MIEGTNESLNQPTIGSVLYGPSGRHVYNGSQWVLSPIVLQAGQSNAQAVREAHEYLANQLPDIDPGIMVQFPESMPRLQYNMMGEGDRLGINSEGDLVEEKAPTEPLLLNYLKSIIR